MALPRITQKEVWPGSYISGRIDFLVTMLINKRACTLLTSVFIGE